MIVYLISYDLNKSDKNYDGVIEAIKKAFTGVWCSPLESVWLIKSNLTANQVSDNIKSEADANDNWLVIEVRDNKQGWLNKDMWEYINNSIFS
ncbi:hypothetical protein MTP04_02220 [Lysinibacillus sp. PLM2]|nr:hypothetical protein MTP04_02220 [Lysinibacillus sp. PLM2]